jgi:hypothetical protein
VPVIVKILSLPAEGFSERRALGPFRKEDDQSAIAWTSSRAEIRKSSPVASNSYFGKSGAFVADGIWSRISQAANVRATRRNKARASER